VTMDTTYYRYLVELLVPVLTGDPETDICIAVYPILLIKLIRINVVGKNVPPSSDLLKYQKQ
jgi:hypothetical protein